MSAMQIAQLPLRAGLIGLCPLPGRNGDYAADFAEVMRFAPTAVVSLVKVHEYQRHNAPRFVADLAAQGIVQIPFPIQDFGTPDRQIWPALSARLHATLTGGGRILIHCLGGCGRTGTIALRLMVESGEDPSGALDRLRLVRPCAVETKAQHKWAIAP